MVLLQILAAAPIRCRAHTVDYLVLLHGTILPLHQAEGHAGGGVVPPAGAAAAPLHFGTKGNKKRRWETPALQKSKKMFAAYYLSR